MSFRHHPTTLGSIATLAIAFLLINVACSPSPTPLSTASHRSTATPAPPPTSTAMPPTSPSLTSTLHLSEITSKPTGRWSELLQCTPYPYSTPLPPAAATALDGTYTKVDPYSGQHVPCKRCPAYPPGAGVWRLNLDKGIFRVHHEFTDWVTLGSFTVSGDQIEFFNDPHCFQDTGTYTWKLEDGNLILDVIDDNCGVYLRKKNLAALPWKSCQPPTEEAAITGHWPVPPGCQND